MVHHVRLRNALPIVMLPLYAREATAYYASVSTSKKDIRFVRFETLYRDPSRQRRTSDKKSFSHSGSRQQRRHTELKHRQPVVCLVVGDVPGLYFPKNKRGCSISEAGPTSRSTNKPRPDRLVRPKSRFGGFLPERFRRCCVCRGCLEVWTKVKRRPHVHDQ